MGNISATLNIAYQSSSKLAPLSPKSSSVSASDTNTSKALEQSVHVEISDEAKEKKLQENNQQAHRKLMRKGDIESVEESSGVPTLDEMIAKLQEEITQLSQEMAKLRSKGDEESGNKAKALETQLASLSAQLMNLLTQKVEQEQNQSQ